MMKFLNLILLTVLSYTVNAQHTFSIVAVDPATGEVGGAGATCYSTVNDIADVHPGVGFIHTQSYVNYTNQALAKQMMDAGLSPQEIMDSIQVVDADNDSTIRQYAVVDLTNGGRSAAFTGTNCYDYKGHRLGATYAIAGNILLGPQILDSMESRFNNTQGTLADKLMAALEGAKVIGADKRCLSDNVSSLSAYMIVAKPTDTNGNYYINLNVENILPQDPIDVLSQNYTDWKASQASGITQMDFRSNVIISPNPASTILNIDQPLENTQAELLDSLGRVVLTQTLNQGSNNLSLENLEAGCYFVKLSNNNQLSTHPLIIK